MSWSNRTRSTATEAPNAVCRHRFSVPIFSPLVKSRSSTIPSGESKCPSGSCLASFRFNARIFMLFPPKVRHSLCRRIHGKMWARSIWRTILVQMDAAQRSSMAGVQLARKWRLLFGGSGGRVGPPLPPCRGATRYFALHVLGDHLLTTAAARRSASDGPRTA